MSRVDRLHDILGLLRRGGRLRARDIAARLGVSLRTVYRDMDALAAAGVPVEGTRGAGYRLTDAIALPPLTLTPAELDALNLGLAIVAEATDTGLSAAARSLADKLDTALPAETVAEADAWKFARTPFAGMARGVSHMGTLRAAIRGRQKLRLAYRAPDGTATRRTIRPLRLQPAGRAWILTAWCELRGGFREFRLDLIEDATALPELFVDEPGKRLADFDAPHRPA